jgi:hypothetical protein
MHARPDATTVSHVHLVVGQPVNAGAGRNRFNALLPLHANKLSLYFLRLDFVLSIMLIS